MSKNRFRHTMKTTATPDQAWEGWAKPEHIQRWFADKAHGEPTEGGTITLVFEKFGMQLPQTVLEAVPGERLVVQAMGPGGIPVRQELVLRREGGETVLELVHSGFDEDAEWGEEFEGMDSGWTMALAILKHYLEHHFARERTNYFVMRPATVSFETLAAFFRTEAGLARWLTRAGSVGEVGEPIALTLQTGAKVTGEVIAWSGREAAVSWEEARGVLELKAFSMGPGGSAIALRAASWADAPPAVSEVEAWMSAALDRLAVALGDVGR